MSRATGDNAGTVTRPLEGIRVVDLTHAYAGPLCTYNLGLLGADVLKVEPPETGDDFRVWFENAFVAINAGKRSFTLDLRTPDGQAVLHRLLERSDVLVENYRPGAAARLGIDAGEIRTRHPRLVYCSITGFGDTGPLRDAPAIEWAVQATAGVTAEYLNEEDDPTRAGLAVVDAFSGFTAASSILAALLLRERTGEGSRLDVAMFDAALGLLSVATTDAANGLPGRGLRLPGSGRFHARDRVLTSAASTTSGSAVSARWSAHPSRPPPAVRDPRQPRAERERLLPRAAPVVRSA